MTRSVLLFMLSTLPFWAMSESVAAGVASPRPPGSRAFSSLVMVVGDQRFINAPSARTVTISNPVVAKVIIEGRKIHVVARKSGTANVALSPKDGVEITVLPTKMRPAFQAASLWIQNKAGLEMSPAPDRILISGTAMKYNDWRDILRMKKKFTEIKSEVRPSPQVLDQIAQAVNDKLRSRSISAAHLELNDDGLTITAPNDKNQSPVIHSVAQEFGIDDVKVSNALELKPMIEVDILIAEVKKNSFRSLGLKTPGIYSATVLPASDLSSAAVNFNGITPELHALFTQDAGRVLANPKLVCRSGEKADFIAGGEIPIKIMNWKNADVVWKKYGVILQIKPVADEDGRISAEIATEVSLLDDSHKVDGIPALLTNRIQTHFDLRGSRTIALSGLIKSELGRNTTGIPLLGEIPILGALFRSKDYRDSRTELVVFVTPRIVNPDETASDAVKIPDWDDE